MVRRGSQVLQRQAERFRLRVSEWSELADLVEHFSYFSGHDWLFRGVTDAEHTLVPKIGRPKARASKLNDRTHRRVRVPYRPNDERAVFSMFHQQASAHLPARPQTLLEWMAIAQHFGLPTRLLDWTDMFLVAAWFAVEKAGDKKVDSAIWVTKGVHSVEVDSTVDPLDVREPNVYRPAHISPRIAAQGSVLMICPDPKHVVDLSFVRKITIARKVEFRLKKRLNACGINKRQLYPDLAGLTEHLTWLYKNDWLAGFRQGGDSKTTTIPNDLPIEAR